MIKRVLTKYWVDAGLLVLRIGIGGMYVAAHGAFKIFSGPQMWEKVGGAMNYLGVDFGHTFFGFLASCSEFIGGIFIALGLLVRPSAAMMLATMFVASSMHLLSGDGFGVASHAIENGIVFIGLIIMGPGKYSLDRLIFGESSESSK